MKKILTIIATILFLAFGFSLRKTSKELDNQEIKDAVNEYKICLDKIEKMKITLEKNKSLTDEELVKLKELEEKYEALSIEFNDYKKNYPQNINEEIKTLNEENNLYSNKVEELENKVATLNNKVQTQQQVVASSNNSSNVNSSSNSSSSPNSSSTVYANGGSSKSNKYHKSANAHNMKGAIPMSEDQAKSNGYVACKKCY